jgi:hypothetical protein
LNGPFWIVPAALLVTGANYRRIPAVLDPRREGQVLVLPNLRDENGRLRQRIQVTFRRLQGPNRASEGLLASASWPPATLDRRLQDIRF